LNQKILYPDRNFGDTVDLNDERNSYLLDDQKGDGGSDADTDHYTIDLTGRTDRLLVCCGLDIDMICQRI
jgi:hypothetical protein